MMKTLTIISVLFLASMTAHFSVAQDKPSDRETLIKASQILEVEPFVDKAKDFRSWAMDKKNRNADELLAQYTIAMAAFKLSDPVKAKDDNAAQLAGMESMLRAYENMVKVKPKTKFAALDELVKRRDSGELKKFVEGAECGKGETAPVK